MERNREPEKVGGTGADGLGLTWCFAVHQVPPRILTHWIPQKPLREEVLFLSPLEDREICGSGGISGGHKDMGQ